MNQPDVVRTPTNKVVTQVIRTNIAQKSFVSTALTSGLHGWLEGVRLAKHETHTRYSFEGIVRRKPVPSVVHIDLGLDYPNAVKQVVAKPLSTTDTVQPTSLSSKLTNGDVLAWDNNKRVWSNRQVDTLLSGRINKGVLVLERTASDDLYVDLVDQLSIDDLSNVSLNDPVLGETLMFNGTHWVNSSVAPFEQVSTSDSLNQHTVSFPKYSNGRDDSSMYPAINFLYTDAGGALRSAPTSVLQLDSNVTIDVGNGVTHSDDGALELGGDLQRNTTIDQRDRDLVFVNGKIGLGALSTSHVGIGGSVAFPIKRVSWDYTLGVYDFTLLVESPSVTISLPPASQCIGRIYTIKSLIQGDVIIFADNGETIDGLYTCLLSYKYDGCTLQSDGEQWHKLSTTL